MQEKSLFYKPPTIPEEEREALRNSLQSYLTEDLTLCSKQHPYMILADYKTIEKRASKISEIISTADSDGKLMKWILDMSDTAIDFYLHSVQVCYLSVYIMEQYYDVPHSTPAKRSLVETELETMAVAGLLHDIGKYVVGSPELKDSEIKLIGRAAKQYRNHVVNGNAYLRHTDLPSEISQAVLQHHETCDGTGFPLNLKEESICLMAKIIAIADTYANFNVERKSYDPFYCIGQLEKTDFLYDSTCLTRFWKGFLPKLVGKNVRLSDGRTAIFTQIEDNFPTKSRVKIGTQNLPLKDSDIYIAELVHEEHK